MKALGSSAFAVQCIRMDEVRNELKGRNNRKLQGKPLDWQSALSASAHCSATGGLELYCACAMKKNPACMLFANRIDFLAAAGVVLADV